MTKPKSPINVVIAIILVALGVTFIAFAVGAAATASNDGEISERTICTGDIRVPLTIGDPEIGSETSCVIEECGIFDRTFSILPDFLTSEGKIRLVIDGKVQDTASWESSFGANQDFTLESQCLTGADSAEIQLFDEDNHKVDTFEVTS